MAAVFWREAQQVHAVEVYLAGGDGKCRIAGKYLAEGALAGAVGSHDGMYLAGAYLEVDAFEYLFAFYRGMQIFYVEKKIITHIVIKILSLVLIQRELQSLLFPVIADFFLVQV